MNTNYTVNQLIHDTTIRTLEDMLAKIKTAKTKLEGGSKWKETNLFNITFFTKVSCMFNLFDKMGGKDKGMESFMMMQMLGGQGGMQGQDILSTYFQFKMMSNLMGGEGDFDPGFNSLFEAFEEKK